MVKKLKSDKNAKLSKLVGEMLHQILAKDTDNGIGTDNMSATLIKITNE